MLNAHQCNIMKTYNYNETSARIYGLLGIDSGEGFIRLPKEILERVPRLKIASDKPVGGRLCFRTASKKIRIEIFLENVFVDRGFAFYQSNVANCFIGERKTAEFAGILSADKSYDENSVYGEFNNNGLNDITVYLPRNPTVTGITISVDDDAEILPPTPYTIQKPFVFYGSSIVEQGHCSNSTAYTTLISRYFDADFYNFGFSGDARGDIALAEFFGKMPKTVFFYDYDHNAPDAEFLRNTHYPFYETFRKFDNTSPIIMSSKPADDFADTAERLEIIKETYAKAKASGDENIYFIDGGTFFDGVPLSICTTDRTHPNDLGHYLMAKKEIELLKEIGIQ